jgi:hypothetical protein
MRRVLHILTRENEMLALKVIDGHREQPDWQVEVVDLTKTEPDYRDLLEKVFAADSVQVW